MVKVSIIIPTYNRAKMIDRAINSALSQTFRDYEIIVIDDGSTDNTKDVLKPFNGKIRYFLQKNQGSAAARNHGIREARGEYIAFLDSDDYWVPEKLEEQVGILDTHPRIGIVYSRMPIMNDKGECIGYKPAGISGKNYKELLEVWGDLPTSTVMTRKASFEKAGFFDTSLTTMQDIDMWLRISRFYDLYEIENKILAFYSRHANQITRNRIKVYEGLVTLFRKILNTYEDVPRDLYIKKIAMNQYTLSRAYYAEKRFDKAWDNLTASLSMYPLVGNLFVTREERFAQKLVKQIKPFGYFFICLAWMCCFQVKKIFAGGIK